MLVVPLGFVIGGLLAYQVVARLSIERESRAVTAIGRRRLRIALVVCLVLGYVEEAHQWSVARAVPLLSSNIDAARFRQPGGPTIVLTDFLTVAAIAALVVPANLFRRDARFELAVAAAALGAFALAGGRSTVVMPLAAAVLVRAIYWGMPRLWVILGGGALVAAGASAVFYVRVSQHRDDVFGTEFYGHVLPSTPRIFHPLIPLDLSYASNFATLARIVDYFPAGVGYGHGRYDLHGLDLFFPQARDIAPLANELTPSWVTSTVAGPFWADGGMPFVVVGLLLIGFLTLGAYAYARRTQALRHALVAGFFLFLALFGFYQNLWTQQVDWLLVVPSLYVVGRISEGLRPIPHVSELTSRVRQLRNRGDVTSPDSASALSGHASSRRLRPLLGVLAAAGVLLAITATWEAERTPILAATALPSTPFGVVESLPLPAGVSTSSVVGDPAQPGGRVSFWSIRRGGRGLKVTRWVATGTQLRAVRSTGIAADGTSRSTYSVDTWAGKQALAVVDSHHGRIGVRIFSLSDPTRLLAASTAAVEPAAAQTVALARWSGRLPDLFVVSLDPRSGTGRITILSGESGFTRRLVSRRFELKLPTSQSVRIAVVPQKSAKPDIAFLIGDGRITGSRLPELHVLDGNSLFQKYGLQTALGGLPRTLPRGYRIATGSSSSGPSIYVITHGVGAAPTLSVIPFGS
jgi:hypothetical protein